MVLPSVLQKIYIIQILFSVKGTRRSFQTLIDMNGTILLNRSKKVWSIWRYEIEQMRELSRKLAKTQVLKWNSICTLLMMETGFMGSMSSQHLDLLALLAPGFKTKIFLCTSTNFLLDSFVGLSRDFHPVLFRDVKIFIFWIHGAKCKGELELTHQQHFCLLRLSLSTV